jgi:hypothetical protein
LEKQKEKAIMRIINLDETGIKIITSNKKQMYLSLNEIKEFIAKKYTLDNNILTFDKKKLILSDKDVLEFPNIVDYITSTFNSKFY